MSKILKNNPFLFQNFKQYRELKGRTNLQKADRLATLR
jgi:hypothetical protein